MHDKRLVYNEPRRAVAVSVNGRFSLAAIGMQRLAEKFYDPKFLRLTVVNSGSVHFTNFPSQEGEIPISEPVQIPNPFNRQSGPVCTLEWSSDGYVLAVGWQNGWAIFSVGGRCLAWGFGIEESVDEAKSAPIVWLCCKTLTFYIRFQDSFMYGISDLVSPNPYVFAIITDATAVLGSRQF
jgi:RAB6A-GEF complex partner protein 1